MTRPKSLKVHLGNTLVAHVDDKPSLPLRYVDDVLETRRGEPVLSCSLPVSNRALDARNFFDGVLPEGTFRESLAARADVVASDSFGLLHAYGRDVAGALVVTNPDEAVPDSSHPSSAAPLSTGELEQEVIALPDRPLGIHDDSELSIAGLQNKMLLIKTKSGWARPIGGTPSTHILKLDSQAHPGVVAAEAEALTLARALDLTTVSVELMTIAGIDCIAVERFDRATIDGITHRIHQEDICQALNYPPTQKYELPGRGRLGFGGGPEFSDIAQLIDRHAASPNNELDTLARIATFTALIGNSDAHGKNLSLLHHEGKVRIAPLYDTVPTILFPRLKDEAAMTIGGATNLANVTRLSIRTEARHWNANPDRIQAQAEALAEAVLEKAPNVLPSDSPVGKLATERATRFLTSREALKA